MQPSIWLNRWTLGLFWPKSVSVIQMIPKHGSGVGTWQGPSPTRMQFAGRRTASGEGGSAFAEMHTIQYRLTSMPRIVPGHVLFTTINMAFEHRNFILLYGYDRHFSHFLKHLLLNVCTAFSLHLFLQHFSTLKRQLWSAFIYPNNSLFHCYYVPSAAKTGQ